MRINFFPRQRAAKRSPHSYTAEGAEAVKGTEKLGLWHLWTARPRPESINASVSLFFKGVKPKEVGAGCLFFFLINGHSDLGAGRDKRLNPP